MSGKIVGCRLSLLPNIGKKFCFPFVLSNLPMA
jgi:hypothetical protein